MNFKTISPKIVGMPVVRPRYLLLSCLLFVVTFSTVSQFRKHSRLAFTHQSIVPPASCDGRRIYVYNLDPSFNLEFVYNCSTFKKNVDLCAYMENGGMGRQFSYESKLFEDGLWFNTWQFSLEIYFHVRLLNHPCIAETEEIANAFYVPFYAGMDLSNRMTHPSLKRYRQKKYMDFLDWLRGQPYFLRNGGLDHFITLGRIALDFRRPTGDSWGTQMLLQPDFQSMVKLTLERDGITPIHSNNEIAIPYPSYFHGRNNIQIENLRKWAMQDAQRSILVSIAGGRRAGQGGIREKLMNDCQGDRRCTVLVCEGHESDNEPNESSRTFSFLPIAGHSLKESCNVPSTVLDIFHRSVFCLQPPGDSPTRRSFIDSMIAGCIPVIFKPSSAWTQWTAFLPQDGEEYSVLIPIAEIRNHNIVDVLANVTETKIEDMRTHIQELLPRILYAHVQREYPRHSSLTGKSDEYSFAHDQIVHQYPHDLGLSDEDFLEGSDAFDIALGEVFSLMKKNMAKL